MNTSLNTYEALIILKPILDVDNSDNVLKSIEDNVENLKGKVLKKDKLGRKRLAYEINKFKDGFVTTYLFSLEPSSVVALRRTAQLNEDILRMVLINRNDVDMNDATIYGRERPGDRGERGDRDRGGDRGDREHRFRGGDRDRDRAPARTAE
ncbi:MAG TPA: 30S ribosomal protein S6 [Coleofasciculaceae cyanobacterium]|jgi:small subunit ribosomal protein S6